MRSSNTFTRATPPLIGDITGEMLEQFLNGVKARTSASTANGHRKVLNAFFAHALKNKKIRNNPVKDVATYKRRPLINTVLTI